VSAAGCQSAVPDEHLTQRAVTSRWLAWLHDGQTDRQAVTRELGEPTRSYEGRRLVAYHLYLSNPHKQVTHTNFAKRHCEGFGAIGPGTQLCAAPAEATPESDLRMRLSAAHYSLVMVYDQGDVVRAHSLLWRAP
jgi:hypothetical protein